MRPQLDRWIDRPTIQVSHRREANVPAEVLWRAAQTLRLRDTSLLGRLIRWRIPGTPQEITFEEMFRRPPFTVLEESELALVSGLVGRIWTLRRDYPRLEGAEAFQDWQKRGTARVVFASWVESLEPERSALVSESRVESVGRQGRLGVALVRPIVSRFAGLVGSDGIAAAVRRAERERSGAGTPSRQGRRR